MCFGVASSFFHLGSPLEIWHTVANVRESWLGREILLATLFLGSAAVSPLADMRGGLMPGATGYLLPGLFGLLTLLIMVFRQRTVPVWKSWHVTGMFSVGSILLGSCVVALILVAHPIATDWVHHICLWVLGLVVIALLTLQILLFSLWFQRMVSRPDIILALRGRPLKRILALFWTRLLSAAFGLLALTAAGVLGEQWLESAILLTVGTVVLSEVVGRMFFYEVGMRE
jgi:DMSO reductase anchor subunit